MDWALLWFVLLGVLLAGYAILDGFDFGVGLLHLVAKDDHERRVMLNSIGPLWDGNEVWLVTFGGALFAAFPEAYATVFSGMYTAFMVVLGALIFRAVSIEFRSKFKGVLWRKIWDTVFTLASTTAPLVFGVGVGNAIAGVPLDSRGIMRASFLDLLTPYPLMMGIMVLLLFGTHGGLFLQLRTEGELKNRIRRWTWRLLYGFLITFVVVTGMTLVSYPNASENFKSFPLAFLVVVLMFLAVANIPRCLKTERHGQGFLSSASVIAALVFLLGMSLYPNLVVSSPVPENSLTIHNAASSVGTLKTMALFAAIGLPFVISYSAVVYWTFWGKVELNSHSY